MRTISLRYTDKFAPHNGTIKAHQSILDDKGYVWYGKMGAPISATVAEIILQNDEPRFLLIHSGHAERYWMYIDDVSREIPIDDDFPAYYHEIADRFKTWFRVVKIEQADKDVIRKEELTTNWDQGEATCEQVLEFVRVLADKCRGKENPGSGSGSALIGADICGECTPDQEGCDIDAAIAGNDVFNKKVLEILRHG